MMYWPLLGILFIVCAILCSIGFYKFVYFLSVGYGLAIAGGGIALLVMYQKAIGTPPLASVNAGKAIENLQTKAKSKSPSDVLPSKGKRTGGDFFFNEILLSLFLLCQILSA